LTVTQELMRNASERSRLYAGSALSSTEETS
jgi:hypothetical protein